MRVEQHHARMDLAQAVELGAQRRVIGREIRLAAARDLSLAGRLAAMIERRAVEIGRRTQLGRRLTRIERGAGGIAVDVDHAARDPRAHRRRAHRMREIVEPVDPPIRIAPRVPERGETRLKFRWNIGAGVRKAHHQGLFRALDREPVLRHATSVAPAARGIGCADEVCPALVRAGAAAARLGPRRAHQDRQGPHRLGRDEHAPRHAGRGACRRPPRPSQPAQPRLPARHGGAGRDARADGRQFLDLARDHVPLRRAPRPRRVRSHRRDGLRRDAGSPASRVSASSTICTAIRRARLTPIRPRWPRASPPLRTRRASG